jgi:hypothetical protein
MNSNGAHLTGTGRSPRSAPANMYRFMRIAATASRRYDKRASAASGLSNANFGRKKREDCRTETRYSKNRSHPSIRAEYGRWLNGARRRTSCLVRAYSVASVNYIFIIQRLTYHELADPNKTFSESTF